jgi:dipeptidyl aminopeptidase/acylaminoacyl peptidase
LVAVVDEKQLRQYGLWESPITPASIARGIRLSDVQWSPDGRTLVWREERSGVGVLVCQRGDSDAPVDLTDDLSVRARVSYGGGDFTVTDDAVFFVEQTSGRIYRQSLAGGRARAVTPPFGTAASPVVSADARWLVYVHSSERVDRIAIVDAEGRGWPEVLVEGHDFFMQPAWSPDGRRLAWVAWDHPLMPWDGSRVFVATLDARDGGPPRVAGAPEVVAGGDHESVFQPTFTPDGRAIAYVTDESGWSRLVVRDLATGERRPVGADGDEAEYGTAAWIQGMRTYAILPDSAHAFVSRSKNGFVDGSIAAFESGAVLPHGAFAGSYTDVEQPAVNPVSGAVAAIVASAAAPPRVVVAEPFAESARIVRRTASENVAASALATPEAISWPALGGAEVHGLF